MEKLLTPEDAAERLAVSPKTIRDWLRMGKLKGVRAGRLWRIREEDLEAFLSPKDTKN
jgi:excisionase family DNA binding protein